MFIVSLIPINGKKERQNFYIKLLKVTFYFQCLLENFEPTSRVKRITKLLHQFTKIILNIILFCLNIYYEPYHTILKPYLALVEIIIHFFWFHSYFQAPPVSAKFTIGSIVTTNLALTMTKNTPKNG